MSLMMQWIISAVTIMGSCALLLYHIILVLQKDGKEGGND